MLQVIEKQAEPEWTLLYYLRNKRILFHINMVAAIQHYEQAKYIDNKDKKNQTEYFFHWCFVGVNCMC
jgi:hypothetical protein